MRERGEGEEEGGRGEEGLEDLEEREKEIGGRGSPSLLPFPPLSPFRNAKQSSNSLFSSSFLERERDEIREEEKRAHKEEREDMKDLK